MNQGQIVVPDEFTLQFSAKEIGTLIRFLESTNPEVNSFAISFLKNSSAHQFTSKQKTNEEANPEVR